jgi:peptidyl-prolyl cis-trans isomerase A (cyclophilin A)
VTRRYQPYEEVQMTVERILSEPVRSSASGRGATARPPITPSRRIFGGEKYALLLAAVAIVACKETPRPAVDSSGASAPAPDVFRVRFETTRGSFVVEAHRAWAPLGVDRFHYLVRNGFYDGTRFFRVLNGFMAQFGINGDPRITASWRDRKIIDDPPKQSNVRGAVSFASAGPQSRTTQLFINFRDNVGLDKDYPPIGKVVEGMAAVDSLWKGYGEGAPMGNGPEQERVMTEGERYLSKEFPKLDEVKAARIIN